MNITASSPETKTRTTYAPGRAELLGNHTDYNEGLVLSIAINRGTTIHSHSTPDSDSPDPTLHLNALDLDRHYTCPLKEIAPTSQESWANYILGVAHELQQRNIPIRETSFDISTTIPIGAGLSSSAALEIATAISLKKHYPYSLPPIEIAKIAQAAENHFAGVKCGLLDQISVLMSKADHATYIDCRSYQVEHLPLSSDTAFVIIHSGAKHALSDGVYNERRATCEEAAKALGVVALRDIIPPQLEEAKSKLSEKTYRRAHHIIHENARVLRAKQFLSSGQMKEFGTLMLASHESSRSKFENSCPELDFLVENAAQHSACLGARLSGGGFGGATINLIKAGQADSFTEELSSAYQSKYGTKPLILTTPACAGAH